MRFDTVLWAVGRGKGAEPGCAEVAELLSEAARGEITLATPARAHVEHCLRCQAEIAQYRKLLRALRALRTEVLEPSPGLLTDILASLSEAAERRVLRDLLGGRRAAYVGGIAAAATAAGAGALALAMSRRGRLAS